MLEVSRFGQSDVVLGRPHFGHHDVILGRLHFGQGDLILGSLRFGQSDRVLGPLRVGQTKANSMKSKVHKIKTGGSSIGLRDELGDWVGKYPESFRSPRTS